MITPEELQERDRKEAAEERARQAAIDEATADWNPVGDKVVLATMKPTGQRAGKDSVLYKPDTAEKKGRLARVVRVGPEAALVKPHDRVYCGTYSGAIVDVEGHSLLIVSEGDLLLIEQRHAE